MAGFNCAVEEVLQLEWGQDEPFSSQDWAWGRGRDTKAGGRGDEETCRGEGRQLLFKGLIVGNRTDGNMTAHDLAASQVHFGRAFSCG